ncbi:winged helix-turn-helix domain-containing protein [Sulfurimonas sp. HSL-3221]|uniref:winged helix-turn-helix domain-containing protein n=1 Tax=Thiomicrolovo sulfuroxydans TaxID=2894755 RepID=UPI001E41634C|nr:winged helix-turn-helix domain-containing protein [Sulfurimonas sp. HSL-3221]UFS61571.1 winged helix-turn-helix domain-containing protein [Sulfurimonas sp. HSL-3221]
MLEALFGTRSREMVLQYLLAFDEGYAREISRYLDVTLTSVQQQLANLEEGGVLLSKMSGRTRVYFFNPRYAFLPELTGLLEKARTYYRPELREKLVMQRKRPRRPAKPL